MPGQTLFIIFAVIAIVSALAVVFNKNVVHSALALLVNFATLAALYFMLNAQFLGIAQILVYAGAIVVLFLFVVMLLGADFGEPVTSWLTGRNIFLFLLGLVLLTVLGTAVLESPVSGSKGEFTQDLAAQFGQTEAVGAVLFTHYVLPFQLIAVLLTVGVIGVVWLAQFQQRQKVRQIVAVLDARWPEESQRLHHDLLRVNWLRRQTLFDFDRIEIVDASDADVEKFTEQIGHDTDSWRNSRYPQMLCTVAPDCRLSDHTLQNLRSMFGEVKSAPVTQG